MSIIPDPPRVASISRHYKRGVLFFGLIQHRALSQISSHNGKHISYICLYSIHHNRSKNTYYRSNLQEKMSFLMFEIFLTNVLSAIYLSILNTIVGKLLVQYCVLT